MQTISLKISDELLAELERAAKAKRVAKSVIVRESLETALRPRARSRTASSFDLAADLAGTAVTANVLVPGGVTDTPLVGDAGDRSKMLRPEIMLPPLLWLVSDAAAAGSLRCFGHR